MAPTFDHGAALARNLTDRERAERLATHDPNRTLGAFAKAARSAFHGSTADTRPLGTLEAFGAFGRQTPRAAKIWLDRLGAVKPEAIDGILEGVPPERMSETCRRFTLELLKTNQQRLLE